ncbi:MAG: IPT/TIG domain-containing protein, partial [Terriglobia bacterium]
MMDLPVRAEKRQLREKLLGSVLGVAIFLLVSCHGSHITIVAEPPQACLSVSQTQDITAVVTGTDQKDVAWSVCDGDGENCVPGGNSAVGTIVATGRDADNNAVARYTAPYAVPSPPACLQTAEGCAVAIKADMVSFSAACFSTITIIAPNPVPSITLLTPDSATEGGTGFTLTVDGADFIASSVVQWNGSDRTTTFVSDTQLTADIPDTDIATAGTADVMVFNPAPGGGTSSPLTFTITAGFPLRVSVASDGTQANGQSLQPAVS